MAQDRPDLVGKVPDHVLGLKGVTLHTDSSQIGHLFVVLGHLEYLHHPLPRDSGIFSNLLSGCGVLQVVADLLKVNLKLKDLQVEVLQLHYVAAAFGDDLHSVIFELSNALPEGIYPRDGSEQVVEGGLALNTLGSKGWRTERRVEEVQFTLCLDLLQWVKKLDLLNPFFPQFLELPLGPLHPLSHHALVLEIDLVPAVKLVYSRLVLEVIEDILLELHLAPLLLEP
mmetsp:Transcript_15363/g.31307  ORF Transcript_15363/g.31307 Transcript_15363/m.31307 type:complete len:227 (+) Transcript_15363:3115-3795(+)